MLLFLTLFDIDRSEMAIAASEERERALEKLGREEEIECTKARAKMEQQLEADLRKYNKKISIGRVGVIVALKIIMN